MAAEKHSCLGASASERWLACPGSVRLSDGIPRRSSPYADEGSAAHALAEACLRSGVPASTMIGKEVDIRTRKWEVTEDMAEHVQVYLDVIQADRMALPLSTLRVEVGFHLDWLHQDLWGTCDACLSQPFGRLTVYDLKYGQGVLVSPEDNPQAMYYALGAAHGEANDIVEIVIVQPRGQASKPVKRWLTSVDALETWGLSVLKPAADKAMSKDAPLVPGDHCRWCPALTVCPAVRKTAYSSAAVAFDQYAVPTTAAPTLPDPKVLTPEQLLKIHEVMPLLTAWAEAVDLHIRELVLAGSPDIPFKFVAGRRTRKWTDEAAVIARLKDKVSLFTQKLKTPKGVEDALKKAGLSPLELLEGLVDETVSKSLVPLSDDRPALPGSASAAFSEYTEKGN